ncbi:MAG: hypothetical protein HQ477_00970 [Chloroflexi bacterium]|nr:hypothetical protein [Chloroflexota bacterium]
MKQVNSSKARLLVILLAIAALSISAVACGSADGGGGSDDPIAKIDATDRIYTIEDFTSIGFKDNKSYDVDGLPSAIEVHYGLWGPTSLSKNEFEVRFYASHADAMGFGVEYVEEAIGTDAVLLTGHQRWEEGLRERRACQGVEGGHQVGTCATAKYFDYIVVGNMILMCPGKDSVNSLKACAELMAVVQ